MAKHDIIVIGASAGGVEALKQLVTDLPEDLAAAIFVVVHFPATATSVLAGILDRIGTVPARPAQDHEPIAPGRIYVAVPDFHLLLVDGAIRLSHGPRENGYRPAVDTLFRSAAESFGGRVIGVILSGNGDDGTDGLYQIKQCGGVAVVQDPEDALFSGMPESAVAHVAVDYRLPLSAIPPVLGYLTTVDAADPSDNPVPVSSHNPGLPDASGSTESEKFDKAAGLTCPECGGPLWESEQGALLRFNCLVGHAFSQESYLTGQAKALEFALWNAVRTVEERISVLRRLSRRMSDYQISSSASRFRHEAADLESAAKVLRHLIESGRIEKVAELVDAYEQPNEKPNEKLKEETSG